MGEVNVNKVKIREPSKTNCEGEAKTLIDLPCENLKAKNPKPNVSALSGELKIKN